jgi:hypothetical protein
MHKEIITPLFILFADNTEMEITEIHEKIIEESIPELLEMLKDTADLSDNRLPFVCASITNYNYEKSKGKVLENKFNFAHQLKLEYLASIKELLK